MLPSILNTIKTMLNIPIDGSYAVFDNDIITHINSAFMTLKQLGVGPEVGFHIDDHTKNWSEFIDESRYNEVKTYVYLRVRLLFDPPGTSFHVEAIKEQIKELEWRLSVERERTDWVDPNPPTIADDLEVVDGGVI